MLRKGRREEREEGKRKAESMEAAGNEEEGEGGVEKRMEEVGREQGGAREYYGAHYNGWTWTTGNDNG